MATYEDYDDEMLQQINENVDLVEYVSQTMELKKRGKYYFTSCPKHVDITPSLCFSKENNSFKCFSCGRAGKFIGYLMEYEGLKFDKAVEKAAKIANADLSTMCFSKTIKFLKQTKKALNTQKEEFHHPILDKSCYTKYKKIPITEWLKEGIKPDVMDLFGIRIDVSANRIVYPVYDIDGNLINIKGRTMYPNYKDLGIQKYMNYFSIDVMDYFQGLNITLQYVKDTNEIIIFESIKSVMLAYGWGYKNCVSAEKHNITKEQLNLLVKLKVNVVFAYDSDVSYHQADVKESIDILKRITNVYMIKDKNKLLGGKEARNSPVDLGKDIWETLYQNKIKAI